MAEFLNTSATTYQLEKLIKEATERVIIISPYLRFNDRIKELLEDKDRLKIDVRIVYGKSELAPAEINWLKKLEFVRTSFCENLHAKCYLNEEVAIITSMNLYEFSQQNNNEMGVYIKRDDEAKLYKDTYDEAQRLIRVSEPVRLSADKVEEPTKQNDKPVKKVKEPAKKANGDTSGYEKLTTSKLAKKLRMKTAELNNALVSDGLLVRDGDGYKLTHAGEQAGGESRYSQKYGTYFLWPKDLNDLEEDEEFFVD